MENKLSSAEFQLMNIFYYKDAWRMLIIPDWRLEGFGQVEHQR